MARKKCDCGETKINNGERVPKELKDLTDAMVGVAKNARASIVMADTGDGLAFKFHTSKKLGDGDDCGDEEVEEVMNDFCMMITFALMGITDGMNKKVAGKITQSKLDLGYCMAAHILHNLIDAGATDFYDLHEELAGESVDADDVHGTVQDEEELEDFSDDCDEDGEDDEELKAVLKKLGLDKDESGTVVVQSKNLSKSEMKELLKVLTKLGG